MLRILYIHPISTYGGASKSLTEMYTGIPKHEVEAVVITPRGAAAEAFLAAGMQTIQIAGLAKWEDTRFGHYRGLRWAILMRELAYVPSTLLALRQASKKGPFDLIHCNEIPALLPALLAKKWLGTRLLVHVRSLQRGNEGTWITRRIFQALRRHADAVVAIDEAVRRTLPDDLDVDVIHNGMQAPAQLPRIVDDNAPFRVGIIGVLHRSKGVYEFVEAANILKGRNINVQLVIVGENIHTISGLRGWLLKKFNFAHDVRGDLEAYTAQHRLEKHVEFTGFRRDVAAVYQTLDALCFPSHLDAPGRPVFEAALFGLPTIVAMKNPTSDVIVPDVTGLCIDTPTPVAIADAIATLAQDWPRARAMGAAAYASAIDRFERSRVGQRMLALYQRIQATPSS
jgi:glycosyltransferase involved in cell wall biosynthesis